LPIALILRSVLRKIGGSLFPQWDFSAVSLPHFSKTIWHIADPILTSREQMADKIEIKLAIQRALPADIEAFELELATHNLRMEIGEQPSFVGFITLSINCATEEQEALVQELAALYFGDAPAV
jgi:hypothetical protein